MKKVLALSASLILIFLSQSFTLANASNASHRKEITISGAGSVSLDATIFFPQKLPAPAILLAHGFGGDKDSVIAQATTMAQQGYVVLTWSARGFGKSSGQITMNSPHGEVADVTKLIDYLSTRNEVVQQGPKDPLVGIAGDSYGGAIALMSAGYDHRIDAVATNITWNNLRNVFFPQNSSDPSFGPYKKFWAGTFFSIATLKNSFAGECGTFSPAWCQAFKDAVKNSEPNAADLELLTASSPSSITQRITAPTLLMQGEADSLFPLSESVANAREILQGNPNTPVAILWHAGGHDGGLDETSLVNQKMLDWFDIYLKKIKKQFPRFEVTDPRGSISLIDSSVLPKHYVSDSLPLSQKYSRVAVTTPFVGLIAPVGGIPAAISSLPGVGSVLSLAGGASAFSSAFLPGQSGFLESAPLTTPLHIVGPSTIKIRVSSSTSDAVLFLSLVIRTASGQTKQPNGIVAPVHLTNVNPAGSDFVIQLPSVVVNAAAGDKLAVGISTTDQGYALPLDGRLYTITPQSALSFSQMPVTSTTKFGTLLTWPLIALLSLVISPLIAYLRRPRHPHLVMQEDAKELIAVRNLSKTYKDGLKAVDNLSFSIKRGQVLGLLGPNGAGKTTTLRMMMGLIFPTGGEIQFNGQAIYPGSPALARMGSFVEGSGFLPHLSGRENLHLYWKSIGREDEPYFDEAVALADLGTALDKKVRSYSQGMRQRLAIAQAMLGLPDLLVLDEPTNGLDPQQIKAMREVLKKYAKTGRTVILSSHLLSEVQQTCSHVVLMHRGQLITSGTLKKILKQTGKINGSLEEIFIELVGEDLTIGRAK